jgi:excisionase family DNA binding protein
MMRDLGSSATDLVWLTLGEAARYLGVSEPSLRKWTDRGDVAVFRTPGGHRRYLLDELDRFRTGLEEDAGASTSARPAGP